MATQKKSKSNFQLKSPVKVKKDSRPLPTLDETDETAAEIVKRLRAALSPEQLKIENLSSAHAKHAESKKHGGGHYKIFIVSDLFEGQTKIHREKWVTSLLADLLTAKQIHAISLSLKATAEVEGLYGLSAKKT